MKQHSPSGYPIVEMESAVNMDAVSVDAGPLSGEAKRKKMKFAKKVQKGEVSSADVYQECVRLGIWVGNLRFALNVQSVMFPCSHFRANRRSKLAWMLLD